MRPGIHRGGPRFWSNRDAAQHRAIMAAIRGSKQSIDLPRSNMGVGGVYTSTSSREIAHQTTKYLKDREHERAAAVAWARKAMVVGGAGAAALGGVLLWRSPTLRMKALRYMADRRPLRPLAGLFGDLEALARERGVSVARNVTEVVAQKAKTPIKGAERFLIGHAPDYLEQTGVRGPRVALLEAGELGRGMKAFDVPMKPREIGTERVSSWMGRKINKSTVRVPTQKLPYAGPAAEGARSAVHADLQAVDVARGDLALRSLLKRIADSDELTGSEHWVPGALQKAGVLLKRPLTHLPAIGAHIDPEHELKFGAAGLRRIAYEADVDRSMARALKKVGESPRIRDSLARATGPSRSTYAWQGVAKGWTKRAGAPGPKSVIETYRIQGQSSPLMRVRVPAGPRMAMPKTDSYSALQDRIAREEKILRTFKATTPDQLAYLDRVRASRDALRERAASLLQKRTRDIYGAHMDVRYKTEQPRPVYARAIAGRKKGKKTGGRIVRRFKHTIPLTPARRREIEQATK